MILGLLVLIGLIISGAPSQAETLRLEGEPFQPTCLVSWACTTALPSRLSVYKLVQPCLSEAALSNAMAIGSFKPLNRIRDGDTTTMLFRDSRDSMFMTKYLKFSPNLGWIQYYDGRGENTQPKEVPTFERVEQLARDYLNRLDGDSNQVVTKSWPHIEGTVTSLDKKTGQVTNKICNVRGGIFFRQIDGCEVIGDRITIKFGDGCRVSNLEMSWKKLQPVGNHKTVSKTKLLEWIKAGKAVIVNTGQPVPDPTKANTFAITKAIPCYMGEIDGKTQHLVFPFVQLEITGDFGASNKVAFVANCPIIEAQ